MAPNVIRNGPASSPAARSPSLSVNRIFRRAGCAMAWNTSLCWTGRMTAPLRVLRMRLAHELRPIGKRSTVELSLQPIEQRMRPGQESACGLPRDAPVGHEQPCRFVLGSQLIAKNSALAVRHFRHRCDVPFVFEHARRFPREDLPCGMVPARTRYHLDPSVDARVNQDVRA